ncbi:MAG TPA: SCO family protein [Steroidobacteraceae bacterium]|nr:SCO family protein [Steroidobacteraceae bacterium]
MRATATMPRPAAASAWVRGLAGAAATLLCAFAHGTALPAGNDADAAALRTSQAAIGQRVHDLVLIDEHGRPLRLADLRGRPVVVSFVFTNCYVFCSGLTLHLRDVVRIARDALGSDSFDVLTVGFDSANDTPSRLLAYGRDRGIVDDPHWRFVTADPVTVRQFTDDLGFTWTPSPRGFDHVAQVTLLDAGGVVVRQVYGEAFEPPELVEPLKRVVLRQGLERVSVQGLIERVRLYCSVYDPDSRRYRFDYSMLVAGIPALLVLAMVAAAIAYASRRRH